MATKKKPVKKPAPKAKPKPAAAIAARATRPPAFAPGSAEDALDEPLVDNSGIFRAVDQFAQASQRGSDEDTTRRWPDPSLVMRAQGLVDDD